MARRRSKNRNTQSRRTRRYSPKRSLRSPLLGSILNNGFVASRRTYNPAYTKKHKRVQKVVISSSSKNTKNRTFRTSPPLLRPTVSNFQKTIICARRKQRKEVLHALKKTGQTGQRRPRRNQYSNIKC